ncbi:tetratricopeptide repeat protein 27 [Chelonus insularis]|uniref:tetratricopeptide repeat protein 27 n=1 Tax=Chelonus insularis TaxID=460826 RepID=UPI00158DA196|nr:tetratricopeptide repeat protein 27 [Chelonus insularis]
MDFKSFTTPFTVLGPDAPDANDDLYYKKILDNLYNKLNLKTHLNSDNLRPTIHNLINEDGDKLLEWFLLGTAALHFFVQLNFTGPKVSEDLEWLNNKNDEAHQELAVEDQCNDNAVNLELLYLAKLIFSQEKVQKTYDISIWWLFRAHYVHQLILDETSNVIIENCEPLIQKISQFDAWNNEENKSLEVLFNVEAAHFWLLYKRINNSEKHLKTAEDIAMLDLKLEGAMGKRTKFQQEEKPQLFLHITTGKPIFPYEASPDLPISVNLIDDLRLETIKFSKEIKRPELGAIEESIILAKSVHLQMNQPKDNFAEEEIMPYLNAVIESTKNWPLKMETLRQRCVFEMKDKRGIERALSQSESLVGQCSQSKPSVFYRMNILFASGMKPIWIFKQNLADAMLSLGMVKGALDLYLKLQLWEEVIVCYTILELRHKAAEIIRQQISKKPTVKLWCLLGDAEQDTSHYETAWELSKKRSSRAQRHWGLYYFSKQQYAEAIPHLKTSVQLNNIQENVWIRLGFAAMQVEDWNLAAKAYRHYCELEQTNFEAWNNLAKVYIKLGDKSRAWYSLQDAVKCNYEKWQVWDNLMVVSVDLGHFSEVIRCYHRLLDLKEKHVDILVLRILTEAVRKNINDSEGQPAGKLLHKTLELFGRLTALIHNDPDIWRLYAELTVVQKTDLDFQKAAQYLQRAYRSLTVDPKWLQTIESTKSVLQLCSDLGDTYLKCSENATILQKRSMLGSAKLSLQSVITKVKQERLTEHQDIVVMLESLENLLKLIVEELDKIKMSE